MSQQPLDYQPAPTQGERPGVRRSAAAGFGAVVGTFITGPAIALAVLSGGAGHGDYGFARGLFPVPMCVAAYWTGSIEFVSIAMALVQFPLYGAAVGYFATGRRNAFAVVVLLTGAVHFLAFVLCSKASFFR